MCQLCIVSRRKPQISRCWFVCCASELMTALREHTTHTHDRLRRIQASSHTVTSSSRTDLCHWYTCLLAWLKYRIKPAVKSHWVMLLLKPHVHSFILKPQTYSIELTKSHNSGATMAASWTFHPATCVLLMSSEEDSFLNLETKFHTHALINADFWAFWCFQ